MVASPAGLLCGSASRLSSRSQTFLKGWRAIVLHYLLTHDPYDPRAFGFRDAHGAVRRRVSRIPSAP
jgi:hypothetical protein